MQPNTHTEDPARRLAAAGGGTSRRLAAAGGDAMKSSRQDTEAGHKPILIACEYSQIETTMWRMHGYEAYSCDIIPCTGGHPEWHIQGDAASLLQPGRWGLIIAHPPCTYLTAAAGNLIDAPGRKELRDDAAAFFMKFYDFKDCPMAIENPRPLHCAGLPRYDQVIDPTMFGSHWMKRTCLWLYELPPLLPTHAPYPYAKSWVHHTRGGHRRSKTFLELAMAYTTQWAPFVLNS